MTHWLSTVPCSLYLRRTLTQWNWLKTTEPRPHHIPNVLQPNSHRCFSLFRNTQTLPSRPRSWYHSLCYLLKNSILFFSVKSHTTLTLLNQTDLGDNHSSNDEQLNEHNIGKDMKKASTDIEPYTPMSQTMHQQIILPNSQDTTQ